MLGVDTPFHLWMLSEGYYCKFSFYNNHHGTLFRYSNTNSQSLKRKQKKEEVKTMSYTKLEKNEK